jgi:TonB family protein
VKNSQSPAPEEGKSKDAGKPGKPPEGTPGDFKILSDTMGVDFGPYLQTIVPEIRKKWIELMPQSALPPVSKSGQVILEFAILKDGSVVDMKLVASSGDDALDRAPQIAILESKPFPPLPSGFKGQYFLLRTRFHYNPQQPQHLDVEILSDTVGVDFEPYLQRAGYLIRRDWYNLIPEAAKPPIMKKGLVVIEFAILKDGRLAGLRLVKSSGEVALDRASSGGIKDSEPFPPLPAAFKGEYLKLRVKFYYNLASGEADEEPAPPAKAPSAPPKNP